jgi:tRNA pseudouridine55 synthase
MPRAHPTLHGVLVVDKAPAMTSHDVVGRVRRLVGQREVGHAGTLDPMATGALVVLLGEATKLTPWLTADEKRYACTMVLGTATSSGDTDGETLETRALESALLAELEAFGAAETPRLRDAAHVERDRTTQVPPAISAVHVDGERAYARVRRGEAVVLEPRPVRVRDLTITETTRERQTVSCILHVSKGYYVRAFARDFAATLGTVAHLTALRRLASGPFTLERSVPLADLTRDALEAALIPCEEAAARTLPKLALSAEEVAMARKGQRFPWPRENASGPYAWLSPNERLVAVGEAREGLACVIRGFFAQTD